MNRLPNDHVNAAGFAGSDEPALAAGRARSELHGANGRHVGSASSLSDSSARQHHDIVLAMNLEDGNCSSNALLHRLEARAGDTHDGMHLLGMRASELQGEEAAERNAHQIYARGIGIRRENQGFDQRADERDVCVRPFPVPGLVRQSVRSCIRNVVALRQSSQHQLIVMTRGSISVQEDE